MVTKLASYQDQAVKPINLADLDVSPFNVRKQNVSADQDALIASLKEFGLLQPIVVVPNGDRYNVVVGQRRYLAAQQLGWETIPAFVLDEQLDQRQSIILSLSENVQRRDLPARDRADACEYLWQQLGNIPAVASAVGVSNTTVRRWLGYRAVPEAIKIFVDEGKLSSGMVTRLSNYIQDEDTAIAVATRLASESPGLGRTRLLESATELPGRSAETIIRRAGEKQRELRLVIHLPEMAARGIEEASKYEQIDPEEIAMDAIIQWLQDNRYLRED